MRTLGAKNGEAWWKDDDDGIIYPALSKCCQGLIVEPLFVTARCSECGQGIDLRRLIDFEGQGTLRT